MWYILENFLNLMKNGLSGYHRKIENLDINAVQLSTNEIKPPNVISQLAKCRIDLLISEVND